MGMYSKPRLGDNVQKKPISMNNAMELLACQNCQNEAKDCSLTRLVFKINDIALSNAFFFLLLEKKYRVFTSS